MTDGSTSILEAINVILTSIGEAPVNSVDSGGSDAEIAQSILNEVNREVQTKEWHWNTERDTKLLPTTDGDIFLPGNTLKVYSTNLSPGTTSAGSRPSNRQRVNVTQRGQRLYDLDRKTYNFEGPVYVDLVVLLTFDEIPESCRRYVTMKSARLFHNRVLGDTTTNSYIVTEERIAYEEMLAADIQGEDANMLRDSYDTFSIAYRNDIDIW